MSTENLLPHEEILVEIARACRRFGVMPPITEFINASYERIKPIEQLNDWEDSICGVLSTLNPRSIPGWEYSDPRAEPNEELCIHCLKKFKRVNENMNKN